MKKAGLVILSIVAVLIVGSFSYIKYQEIAIEQEANSLNIPSSWKLISEQKAPAIPLCGDKSGCPSITQRWQIDKIYTATEVTKIFHDSNVIIAMDSECENDTSTVSSSDPIPLCSGIGSKKSYHYVIFESIDKNNNGQVLMTIYLNTKP